MHYWKIQKSLSIKKLLRIEIFFYFCICLCICLCNFLCFGSISQAREIVDATKSKIQVVDHPQRVVTLTPSLAELAADVLGNDLNRIIGVSESTDYPPGLKKVPNLGPSHSFNFEKVISLKPDLVLATLDENPQDQVSHLREMGISVVTVATSDFQEVQDSIHLVSLALGFSDVGNQMVSQLTRGLDRIRARANSHAPLKVLLQIQDDPVIVVGKKSFLHSALLTVGAANLYQDLEAPYPRPSLEDILHRNPDVIILIALGDNIRPFQEMAANWSQFPQLKAVKNHRVHVLKSDALLRPSLRILEGLSLLEQTIYGKK